MSAPTLISYTEVAWNTGDGGAGKISASVSWQANDVIAVIEGCEAATLPSLPTATGLIFVSQRSNSAAGTCGSRVSAVVAGSSGSSTITVAGFTSFHWGFGVWVFRGSAGIGNSAEQHTTTKTVPLTPAAADGAIVYGTFDFNANGGSATLGTVTPVPTNARQAANDGSSYTFYVSDLADQTSAGATSYGFSGGSGVGPYSHVALEIKAGAVVVTGGGSLLLMGVGN